MRERSAPTPRLVYMVRDPIDRLLSHYLHNVGGGYEQRSLERGARRRRAAPTSQRGLYAMQLEPYLERFGAERIAGRHPGRAARPSARPTMRRVFELPRRRRRASPRRSSRASGRRGSAKGGGGFRLMDRAVRLPGLRALDRNFDRLPESLRWRVERIVHDPDAGAAPKPELPTELRARLVETLPARRRAARGAAGRRFGWLEPNAAAGMKIAVAADERTGVAEARRRGAAPARPRAAPARRARRRRARRLGLGQRGRGARRRRGPRRAGDRLLLDRDRRLDRGEQGRRGSARRSARDAATAEGRGVERRERARDQPALDLGGGAGRDPRRLVRGRAERRGRRPRQRRAPRRDRAWLT